MIANSNPTLIIQHKGVRQFAKFVIVGASSTVVNFGLFNILGQRMHWPVLLADGTAFLISVGNGFYWNRHWTFKDARGVSVGEQSLKFMIVNAIAFCLNVTIVSLVIAHFTASSGGFFGQPGHLSAVVHAMLPGAGKRQFNAWLTNGALAVATCVVVFWNFFANRFWTFRH
jgi:putative flippase GtrA